MAPTKKPLRPYQFEAVKACSKVWRDFTDGVEGEDGTALIDLPTGTGKTRIACAVTHGIRRKDRRPAVFMVHREELATQAQAALQEENPDDLVAIEMGDRKAPSTTGIYVVSVPTIGRKGSDRLRRIALSGGASMVWIDEAHHGEADTYRYAIEKLGWPHVPLFGCTATSHRMDGKEVFGVESLFTKRVYHYRLINAIRDGWLAPIVAYRAISKTDLTKVQTQMGDFNLKQLAEKVDNEERTKIAFEKWQEIAGDRITVAFCASVAHAKHTAKWFNDHGVTAAYVHGEMEKGPSDSMNAENRNGVMNLWKAGLLQVVCNFGILTEGFDFPAISCVLMLRPTKSWSLYVQCVGRGTRLFPTKENLILLDVVDVTAKQDIMTAPGLLDLPRDLEMDGDDIEQVEAKYRAAANKGLDLSGVVSPKDIETALLPVDLFSEACIPDEVKKVSDLSWSPIHDGYLLYGGHSASGAPKLAHLTTDNYGTWRLEVEGKTVCFCGRDKVPNFGMADSVVKNRWSESLHLITNKDKFSNYPPTDAMLEQLRQAGIPDNIVASMNRGDARQFIAKIKMGYVKPAGATGAKNRKRARV